MRWNAYHELVVLAQVTTAADTPTEVLFNFTVSGTGDANVTFIAKSSTGNDGLAADIPLLPLQEAVTVSTSFFIDGTCVLASLEGYNSEQKGVRVFTSSKD